MTNGTSVQLPALIVQRPKNPGNIVVFYGYRNKPEDVIKPVLTGLAFDARGLSSPDIFDDWRRRRMSWISDLKKRPILL